MISNLLLEHFFIYSKVLAIAVMGQYSYYALFVKDVRTIPTCTDMYLNMLRGTVFSLGKVLVMYTSKYNPRFEYKDC